MYDVEGLLLNVLILVFFLLFVPLLLGRTVKSPTRKYKKWVFIVSTSLAVITCMTFPIEFSEGFIYDLRFVAQIIGGLYGGILASIILWIVTVTYRGLIGGMGFYSTFIISSIILLLTIGFKRMFHFKSTKKRLIIGAYFSTITSLVTLLLTFFLFDLTNLYVVDLVHYILQLCSVLVIIYVLEIVRENAYINRKIIKAEKMEVVSHLASSISHEVRNPLAVVRGFLQMLEQGDTSLEKRKEFLKISIGEIDRANDIIRNYLTFAKPSPESMEIMDVKQELNRAIEMIKPLANMNSVSIEANVDQFFIKGEPQLFQQCLLNITKNCIEAMQESGQLFIATKVKQKELVIEIIDSGHGMTIEQLSRLGEPYFTTKGSEGTGLGMMAAMKIIELMGGKLIVKSKLNEGTNFKIFLPLVDTDNIEMTVTKANLVDKN